MTNTKSSPSKNKIRADFLKAIGHPLRLSILQMVEEKKIVSVTEICQTLGTEQSLTSHHLANLREKGVLITTRSGKNILYSIKSPHISEILSLVKLVTK
jgi:DNA-binding transcriptional ArsR family regulator